jgi:hypothetical protein
MSDMTKRKVMTLAVDLAVTLLLVIQCGYIGLIVMPYSLYSYWDGMTRLDLK